MRRAVALVTALVVACGGGIVMSASPASAHAEVEGSTPRNGAVVRSAPAKVVIRFGEAVGFDSARLAGPDGAALPSSAEVSGAVLTITPTSTLPKGPITAAWHVTSDDGHEVSGAIAFIVGTAPRTGPAQTVTVFPKIPTRLNGSRPGALQLTLATKGVGGEVEWTSPTVQEPITWKLAPDGRTLVGAGVLPTAGTWTLAATVLRKGGAVVIVNGSAMLTGGRS